MNDRSEYDELEAICGCGHPWSKHGDGSTCDGRACFKCECGGYWTAEELCDRCHDWPCRCLRDEVEAEDDAAFVQQDSDVIEF